MIEKLREAFRPETMFDFASWEIGSVDIGVLIGYFLMMMLVGYICRKSSSDVSDYIRMGCKSTWWLMGLSIFMQAISALTFTGACGMAYVAGWSALFTTIGGVGGLICQAVFFAPWLRRTRAVTPSDAVRQRYGPAAEQIFTYLGAFGGTFWGGAMLLGLATFLSAIFNLPVPTVILFVGIIVIFYSVSGGSWSVQITDSLQSMIMVPICIVVLFLGLKAVGGFGGLLEGIKSQGLSDDFKVIMEPGHQYSSTATKVGAGFFTIPWMIASFLNSFIQSANMTTCWRFLSCKSDTAARKSAILAAALLMFGAFVWYIPPMVARLKFQEQVEALARTDKTTTEAATAADGADTPDVDDSTTPPATDQNMAPATPTDAKTTVLAAGDSVPTPTGKAENPKLTRAKLNSIADGAYAVAAKELLPPGLLGLVIIAMFAATMSSMDSALTGTAGLITKNIYPPLARIIGRTPMEGRALLRLTQGVNLLLGLWAMAFALMLAFGAKNTGIYQICLNIVLLVGAPTGLAFALSFFAKKLPKWGPLLGMGVGFCFSGLFMFAKPFMNNMCQRLLGSDLMWHHKMFTMVIAVIGSTLLTSLFWHTADAAYRKKVDAFFLQLRTPIDFKKEVGEDADHSLLTMVGGLGLIMAAAIAILVFFAKDAAGVWAVLFVVAFIAGISGWMYIAGVSKRRKDETEKAPAFPIETVEVETREAADD